VAIKSHLKLMNHMKNRGFTLNSSRSVPFFLTYYPVFLNCVVYWSVISEFRIRLPKTWLVDRCM